jgi:hypothetical protein
MSLMHKNKLSNSTLPEVFVARYQGHDSYPACQSISVINAPVINILVHCVYPLYKEIAIVREIDPAWRRVRIPPPQSLRVVRGDEEGTQSQMRR